MTWVVGIVALVVLGVISVITVLVVRAAMDSASRRVQEELIAAHRRGIEAQGRAEERADRFISMLTQQQSAERLEAERGWQETSRRWDEERKMLLDRLSDREGRQIVPFLPPDRPAAQSEPRYGDPIQWDPDLAPLGDEEVQATQGGSG